MAKVGILLWGMGIIGGCFFVATTFIGGSMVFNKIFHRSHNSDVNQIYRALEANQGTLNTELVAQNQNVDVNGFLRAQGNQIDSYGLMDDEVEKL